MYVCMVITPGKGKDQTVMVANSARGQLNREIDFFLSSFVPENLVSRFGSPVSRQTVHLHAKTELGACLRDPSRFPRCAPLVLTCQY